MAELPAFDETVYPEDIMVAQGLVLGLVIQFLEPDTRLQLRHALEGKMTQIEKNPPSQATQRRVDAVLKHLEVYRDLLS